LQVVFAFGLAARPLVRLRKSLWPVVLWHSIRDLIAFTFEDPANISARFIVLEIVRMLIWVACTALAYPLKKVADEPEGAQIA
jgi:membrane protease YdiL (CAAX protease family)